MPAKKKYSPPHKYTCITKIGNNDDLLKTAKCVKYRTSNLVDYTAFLDRDYPGWFWTKVYANTGTNKRTQLAMYKPDSKPTKKTLE